MTEPPGGAPRPPGHGYVVPSHADATHESVEADREIQYRQLIWMGISLLILGVVSAVFSFYMLRGFVSWRTATAPPPPVVVPPPQTLPEPRLLANPEGELARVRGAEESALTSYGWVNRSAGVARIPLERALAIAASKGLPAPGSVSAAGAATSAGGGADRGAAKLEAPTPAPPPAASARRPAASASPAPPGRRGR